MKMTDARKTWRGAWIASALAALLVAGCGGGGESSPSNGSSGSSGSGNTPGSTAAISEAGAPAATGDTATDGLNWFNFRRRQMGLSQLARTTLIDKAALNHSNYQAQNNVLSHDEVAGKTGFTGVKLYDSSAPRSSRLGAVGYSFTGSTIAYGEVISKTGDASGFNAAEALIAAIYHRFVVFEPLFQQAGGGSVQASDGYVYFTTDFTANGISGGLGSGRLLPYPFSGQQYIPTVFYPYQEEPNPLPDAGRNPVGYPVSVHADNGRTIRVQSFTIAPRGGATLPSKLLSSATDIETGPSTAAIIPLSVLQSQTVYDVRFAGSVDGVAANLSWSFTTR
jgi:uncharacterized protein YkwD